MAGEKRVTLVGEKEVTMAGEKEVTMAGEKGVAMAGEKEVTMAGEKGVTMAGEKGVTIAGKKNHPTLQPYLQRADDLQEREPLVAYYCRLYAKELRSKIPRTEVMDTLLISLTDQLEKDRKTFELGPDDHNYLQQFALKEFTNATNLNTVEAFYEASLFFDIIGELSTDINIPSYLYNISFIIEVGTIRRCSHTEWRKVIFRSYISEFSKKAQFWQCPLFIRGKARSLNHERNGFPGLVSWFDIIRFLCCRHTGQDC